MKIYLFEDMGGSFTDERPYPVYLYTPAEDVEEAEGICSDSILSVGPLEHRGTADTVEELHKAFPGAALFDADWTEPKEEDQRKVTLTVTEAERNGIYYALELYKRRTSDGRVRARAEKLSARLLEGM